MTYADSVKHWEGKLADAKAKLAAKPANKNKTLLVCAVKGECAAYVAGRTGQADKNAVVERLLASMELSAEGWKVHPNWAEFRQFVDVGQL